jgi:hypothetical protein
MKNRMRESRTCGSVRAEDRKVLGYSERNDRGLSKCAVRRHGIPVGANPTRQRSLQPEAIGAAAKEGS